MSSWKKNISFFSVKVSILSMDTIICHVIYIGN